MTAYKGFITGAATTALDTRKRDAVTLVPESSGDARIGVLATSSSIVTSDPSTSPMRVAVAKAGFATSRGAGDGVALWGNDGSVFVTITKPGTNSWYVVVYAKHNDSSQGDANDNAVIETVTGAAAASPSVPSVPTGALELARILVPSTATSSQSAGVVITNTYPMTAMRGGIVRFRTATELLAWTPGEEGQGAYADDTDTLYLRAGSSWAGRAGILMRRSAAVGNISSASYTALSDGSFWTEENRKGFAAYANGVVVPVAGVYRVSYGISTTSIGAIAGVTVNDSVVTNFTELSLPGSSGVAGGVAIVAVSGELVLAASDIIRLFAIASSGTASWRVEPGSSWIQVEYVRPA